MKSNNKIVVLVLCVMLILVIYQFSMGSKGLMQKDTSVSYSAFLKDLESNKVAKISLNNNLAKVETIDSKVYKFAYPINDISLIDELKAKKVDINVAGAESGGSGWGAILIILAVIGFIIMLFRSTKNSGDSSQSSSNMQQGPFSFGKSRAKLLTPEEGTITFADVAGVDEAKEDLQEVVEFLKDANKFSKLGAKIPKGCLLVGPPGTGKTLLARAVAGEAKVPFFSISGSDFVEMFVGVGASRVRDLFIQAKKKAPCIVFIDEIDAVGRQRGVGVGGGNDEREQTLNQLLVEMDGFSANTGIIVIAATNRSDVLDNALLRPGRFDRQVMVPLPDVVGRERILQIYVSKIPIDKSVNINVIARGTTGFSGADLANLVNEAAIVAAKYNKSVVEMIDFEHAKDKIIMGAERKSSKMTAEDRKLTAYHEAGHALVSFRVDGFYPVHKVTIIPRGSSLGVTSFLPEKDEYNKSYKQLIANLAVLFGGRMAEELIFGKENITTGASMDIQMATNIAKRMVTEWGFSDKLGRIQYTNSNVASYSGYRETSELSTKEIEEEIKNLIVNAENKAREILTTNSKALQDLSEALLEVETLNGIEAKRICDGESLSDVKNINKENAVEKPKLSKEIGALPSVDFDD